MLSWRPGLTTLSIRQAGWPSSPTLQKSPARQSRFIARMREHRVDGILLTPAEDTSPEVVDGLRRQGVPVVQMLGASEDKARTTSAPTFGSARPWPPNTSSAWGTTIALSEARVECRRQGTVRRPFAKPCRGSDCRSARSSIACRRAKKARLQSASCSRKNRTRRPQCFATMTSVRWSHAGPASTSA